MGRFIHYNALLGVEKDEICLKTHGSGGIIPGY